MEFRGGSRLVKVRVDVLLKFGTHDPKLIYNHTVCGETSLVKTTKDIVLLF